MDILALFLKWEDKYWGLYLAGVFLLTVFVLQTPRGTESADSGTRKRAAALGLYGIAGYLLVICPLTYRLMLRLGGTDREYEKLLYIWQYPVLLPLFGALAARLAVRRGEKKRAALLVAGMAVILFVAGDFVPAHFSPQKLSPWLVSQQWQEGYRMILEDSDVRGQKAYIWGPYDWMASGRIFHKDLYPVYGKDIAQDVAKYSQAQQEMYRGYESYEDPDSPVVNKEDQLGAIANMPRLYPEQEFAYVVVYDPAAQGLKIDVDGIFASCGYELTGVSQDLRIYHFNGESEN